MNVARVQITPPVLERYELKYLVDQDLVEPMSRFLSPYCVLDHYSDLSPDRFYPIKSIYLDTPFYLFARNRTFDCPNRFTMRVRGYGEDPQPPYFLEIKQKIGNYIRKFRSVVDYPDIDGLLDNAASDDFSSIKIRERNNFELFLRMLYTYGASPKLLVEYRRKAYASICDDYARVTFDKRLRYVPKERYDFSVDDTQAVYYSSVSDPLSNMIVLELKCYTTHVPIWMLDFIRAFNLQKSAFSKFVNGLRLLQADGADLWLAKPAPAVERFY